MDAKRVATYGMLIALAMVLSFLESLLPAFVAIPGVKLGLTNLVVMVALFRMKPYDAVIINVIRILLVGFTFGNAFSIIYSLAGGLLSFAVMWVLFKSKRFSSPGVGAAGGVAHNIGQLLVAAVVLRTTGVVFYLPVLLISGLIAGVAIGVISGLVVKRLPEKI
ncbi:MAG: Gx transporter family protein [Lachnospiraceae bacterium]|nr:Gx transporter family protein [Lachnospiraceae bacterium]